MQRGSGGDGNLAGVMRSIEGQKSQILVVTGERGRGRGFIGMLGRGYVTSGWEYDPVQKQDGRRRQGRR